MEHYKRRDGEKYIKRIGVLRSYESWKIKIHIM
jgi:hypothetical protein